MSPRFRTMPPVYAHRYRDPGPPGTPTDSFADHIPGTGTDRGQHYYFCATCRARITWEGFRMPIDGASLHSLSDALGRALAIGCFYAAPGCRQYGGFALDFAALAGQTWKLATCAACGAHLGWHCQITGSGGFFALLLDALVAGPGE